MSDLSPEYWKSRYDESRTGWSIGDVSTPVKAYLDQLENRSLKILIPGCGFGYEAAYAHAIGFTDVHILDFIEEPLDVFRRNYPDFPKEHIHREDFFAHTESYDLIIEQTLFCAIDPALREAYARQSAALLKTGGKLTGLLFDRDFPGGPPFGGNREAYEKIFEPYYSVVDMSPCYNSIPARAGTEVFIRLRK